MVNTSLIHTGPAALATQLKAGVMVNAAGAGVEKPITKATDNPAGRLLTG
jgi:hypothetical protein